MNSLLILKMNKVSFCLKENTGNTLLSVYTRFVREMERTLEKESKGIHTKLLNTYILKTFTILVLRN